MGADDLIHVLGKHQIAYLRSCVDAANWLESVSVPEPDASVSCTSSGGQKAVLMRAPTYSFYSSSVFREFHKRLFSALEAPDHQLVVITT
jgi:hypothetical protein